MGILFSAAPAAQTTLPPAETIAARRQLGSKSLVSGEDFSGFASDVVTVLAHATVRYVNRLETAADVIEQPAELSNHRHDGTIPRSTQPEGYISTHSLPFRAIQSLVIRLAPARHRFVVGPACSSCFHI